MHRGKVDMGITKRKIIRVKKEIRKFAISELKRKGISTLNSKPLASNKNKILFIKYQEIFGRNAADNFKPVQYSRDQKIIEKSKAPVSGYVYFIGNKEYGFCKIGFSKKPFVRMLCIQTGSPFILEMFGYLKGTTKDEKYYHRKFSKYRSHGEWFLLKNELNEFLNSGYFV